MTLQVVPLQAVPSQTLSVTLGGQAVGLNVYQKGTADAPVGVFVDIYVSGILILGGVLALNLIRLKRADYIAFVGNLAFFDTQGDSDPYYTGLGTRYQLIYGSDADLTGAITQAQAGAFDPNTLIVNAGGGYFLSYDGVNPIAAYVPP